MCKEHSLLLHAFVSSQIAGQAAKEVVNAADNEPPSDINRRTQRDGNTRGYRSVSDLADRVDPHHKTEWTDHSGAPSTESVVPLLQNVRIFHDKNGNAFLLTQGNLKLPAGLPLMLLNQTTSPAHWLQTFLEFISGSGCPILVRFCCGQDGSYAHPLASNGREGWGTRSPGRFTIRREGVGHPP